MTQDEYIISLATRLNFNLNRLNNSVRFYSKDGNRIIELSKDYLKECQIKGIDPKELKPINIEQENKQKLIHQLFVGKVSDILGYDKTLQLLSDAKKTIDKPINPEDDFC